MINPDHNPHNVQTQACIGDLSTSENPKILSGRVIYPANHKAGVASIALINN